MVEVYDNSYKKMKFHSDQALDLADNSFICIFSCYQKNVSPRKLLVKSKENEEKFEFILENNSIITFSTSINKKFVHKIILDNCKNQDLWLGFTLRLSKTYITVIGNLFYFTDTNKQLVDATDDEKKEFYKLKKIENTTTC